MEVLCEDGVTGQDAAVVTIFEDWTGRTLVSAACALFKFQDAQDMALEVGGQLVYVACDPDVPCGGLPFGDGDTVVLRCSNKRLLSLLSQGAMLETRDIPKWAWGDKQVVLGAVRTRGHFHRHVSEALQADKEVLLAACTQDAVPLRNVDAALLDVATMLTLVRRHGGYCLKYATAEVRGDARFNAYRKYTYD